MLGGALLAFSMIIAVLLSAVGAVAGRCQTEASGVPESPTFVSQEPSGEALADIPADYLALYRQAGEEYGLDWAVLAAVGKIETDHGRLDAPGVTSGENPSGAGGPMQFLASTWASVGVDGNGDGVKDRYDPEDAIPGAANYLKLEGAPQDYRSALFAYNNAGWYVDDVLARAEAYRAAAGEKEGEVASSRPAPSLAALLSPLAMRSAQAAEDGTVGSPGETSYSSLELETLELINGYREENGLEPLQLSDTVSTAAARYAHDMAKYDAYSEPAAHVTGPSDYYPEGADLVARMNAEGYSAARYGENIAAGQESAEGVFEAWRSSPPHDAMMLSPEMRAIGIGLVENPETSYGEFWVTDFGSDLDDTARPAPGAEGAAPSGTVEVEGNTRAVFPLEAEYMDGYEDTWGASRGSGRTHEGTDLFAEDGAPIYSIVGGEVIPVSGADEQGWNELGGWTVMIEASESVGPIKAGDTLYYAHMLEPASVRPGDTVEAGDVIGSVGSTGEGPPGSLLQPASRGRHLHLGWYDPTMQRAEAPSGAMNPYPMLEWLRQSGGVATGGEAAPAAPGSSVASLPDYCDPFVAAGLISGVAETVGDLVGGRSAEAEPANGSGGTGERVVEEAERYLGTPYVLGGRRSACRERRWIAPASPRPSLRSSATSCRTTRRPSWSTGSPWKESRGPAMSWCGGIPETARGVTPR